MPVNPFDDERGQFFVLVNDEEQRSLWPAFAPVPAGWTIEHGAPSGDSRQACLDFVETAWTDLRPLGLRKAMAVGAHDGA
ncbi:MbtH family protein [Segniliparus rugosus]|uniref:MbtH-like domain-containing protein n=1 Tax=Segniliparus rugosus (strain ATCC BAA-974 / DSM 45345 / CCUG 50838 / CIP 108380 / JCM 13579 / CDC 945) TaxID=679197 RepID=E5XLR8_SEGRC|nr:MbtH family NRPS accessory protein [Segniliparus rugosus]EFV14746.1 hypothetical protein HMPREF9336_00437 [Segniliparus rugosus ATCC BAA-974]